MGRSTRSYRKEAEAIVSAVKSQSDKFIEKARELGTDEDEARFDETLRRISKAKPPKGEKKKQS